MQNDYFNANNAFGIGIIFKINNELKELDNKNPNNFNNKWAINWTQ
jgi:hypothetical protein